MDEPDTTGLSRRRLLAALGAVGVSAAGAGLGSVSYVSDRERFPTRFAAGALDLKLDYRSTYNGEVVGEAPVGRAPGAVGVDCGTPGLVDGEGVPVIELADVKPGDCGTVTASLHVCENPSRLWLAADLVETAENDRRPEEVAAGDETAEAGELQDLVWVTCWVDADCDGLVGDGERVLYEGTLAGFGAAAGAGLLLTGDGEGPTCVDAADGVRCVGLSWCLPLDGPNHNRAITDSLGFDLRFAAVQCRHDDAGSNPFADDEAATTESEGLATEESDR